MVAASRGFAVRIHAEVRGAFVLHAGLGALLVCMGPCRCMVGSFPTLTFVDLKALSFCQIMLLRYTILYCTVLYETAQYYTILLCLLAGG